MAMFLTSFAQIGATGSRSPSLITSTGMGTYLVNFPFLNLLGHTSNDIQNLLPLAWNPPTQ